ncbi:DUF2975 domain-containing protein [Floricoccus penangensis]|uniref:DUF2975 domain-containing protein n=1 Tax=Floricoccus penangensis TaxID=1859475 RepID=UPI00203FA56D|nr:DUF2975 domain-containing protein [Floricoccus penangensis]URZ86589.1 hypothetical protein KIW23_05670 [Floricoccus penangensis]
MNDKKFFKFIKVLLIITIAISIIGTLLFSYYYLFKYPGKGYIILGNSGLIAPGSDIDANSIPLQFPLPSITKSDYFIYLLTAIIQTTIFIVMYKIFDNLSNSKFFIKANVRLAKILSILIFLSGFSTATTITDGNTALQVNIRLFLSLFGDYDASLVPTFYDGHRVIFFGIIALVIWSLAKILEDAIIISEENEFTV